MSNPLQPPSDPTSTDGRRAFLAVPAGHTPLKEGKLLDFFKFYDLGRPQHVEGLRRLERSLRELAPVALPEGALMELVRGFDASNPLHVAGVRWLEWVLRQLAPALLTDQAYWVEGWRKAPAPKPAAPKSFSVGSQAQIVSQAQSRGDSCGQASCAMAINALTGKNLDDNDFDARYRFGLLAGLKAECPAWEWWDQGNIGPDNWDDLEECLKAGGLAVAAGNGDTFSQSGRGHIVLIYKLTEKSVSFVDPNGARFPAVASRFRTITRAEWEAAPRHPHGNFLFLSRPRKK